jgi:peptidoglycan hydrolase-like protein with peptidoglycan-binding domain
VFKAGYDFSIKQMTENASAYTKQFRREFQRLMKEAGVYDGRIDGSFGPGTRRAIEALPAAG